MSAAQVPTVIYAVLAGSLSDRFGRGPLLFLPIIGQILEGVALLVNKVSTVTGAVKRISRNFTVTALKVP